MKIRISPSQVQKTILAPSMQQSIKILLLPVAELNTAIENELQENPLLEIDEEKTASEKEPLEQLISERLKNMEIKSIASTSDIENDEELEDRPITMATPLEEYLLQQLRLEISDPLELKIGELIIGDLNEDGYLKSTCEEIAELLKIENILLIEQVLNTIQSFEPLGIAAKTLQECLCIQAHYKFNGKAEIVTQMIKNFLPQIGAKKYTEISRKLKIPQQEVSEIIALIGTLEPKPARNYRPIAQNIYIKPDLIISEVTEGVFSLRINNEYIPHLRINHFYQAMLKKENITVEEKEFIIEKIKGALSFIRSIEQRSQTIRGIAEYILNHQKDFFAIGHIGLRPLILKDVALALERNESTICRAINNKYMDTPQGTFPLKYFFSQAASENANDGVSSRSVKEEIKWKIEQENKAKPLSDQEIFHHLSKKGMEVSRRTISKYRHTMKILPSHLRKV